MNRAMSNTLTRTTMIFGWRAQSDLIYKNYKQMNKICALPEKAQI